jgi:hypothetical protein
MTEKPSTYRVVYVEPGKPACVREIGTELEDIQEAVGGGPFECVYPHEDNTMLVCNDEGKLLGMEGNRRLDTGSIIAGPFFVIGDAGENFRSLTDAEVETYLQKYAEPEIIPQHEVQQDMGWIIYSF